MNSCSPLLNLLFVNISSVKKTVVVAAQIKKQKSRRREEINEHQTVRHTVNQWQSLRPLVRPHLSFRSHPVMLASVMLFKSSHWGTNGVRGQVLRAPANHTRPLVLLISTAWNVLTRRRTSTIGQGLVTDVTLLSPLPPRPPIPAREC